MLRVRLRSVPGALLLVALLGVLLSGCRLDLVAPIELHADGSSTAGLTVRFDPRLLAELDAVGVDPTAELTAVVAGDPEWTLTRTREDSGALTVAVRRELADDAALSATYAALSAGLASADPALELDLDVRRDDRGGVEVTGTALLRPPATSGLVLEGEELGPDADTLAALMEELVDARVEVTMPGPVTDHDAVALDRTTVRVQLQPGQPRSFTITSSPPPWWAGLPGGVLGALVAAGVLVVLLGAGLLLVGRRRGVTRAG